MRFIIGFYHRSIKLLIPLIASRCHLSIKTKIRLSRRHINEFLLIECIQFDCF